MANEPSVAPVGSEGREATKVAGLAWKQRDRTEFRLGEMSTTRDCTSNIYCNLLFVNDLITLQIKGRNKYRAVLRDAAGAVEKAVTVSGVTVFGTIVEIKDIGERGTLYTIDDGTGIVVCKYNDRQYQELLDIASDEQRQILSETFSIHDRNDSRLSCSISDEDTVFNDRSLQEEEALAVHRNKLKALLSIWRDVEDSFGTMSRGLNISDTVLIHGRLYNYMHLNQIHVNAMRLIDIREEILLTNMKLENGYKPLVNTECKSDCCARREGHLLNNRQSGVMTFDHIHHSDRNETNGVKILVAKDMHGEKRQARKRSIVSPQLFGSMTFDTFTGDLNDSVLITKSAKIG